MPRRSSPRITENTPEPTTSAAPTKRSGGAEDAQFSYTSAPSRCRPCSRQQRRTQFAYRREARGRIVVRVDAEGIDEHRFESGSARAIHVDVGQISGVETMSRRDTDSAAGSLEDHRIGLPQAFAVRIDNDRKSILKAHMTKEFVEPPLGVADDPDHDPRSSNRCQGLLQAVRYIAPEVEPIVFSPGESYCRAHLALRHTRTTQQGRHERGPAVLMSGPRGHSVHVRAIGGWQSLTQVRRFHNNSPFAEDGGKALYVQKHHGVSRIEKQRPGNEHARIMAQRARIGRYGESNLAGTPQTRLPSAAMRELNSDQAVNILNSIMEYELAGVVRYTHYALMVTGPNRIPIVDFMTAQASESLLHAQRAGEILTGLEGHPSLGIAHIEETHQHSVEHLLTESLNHEEKALSLYKQLLDVVTDASIYLEEYARQMIGAEELHAVELRKMLRDYTPGDNR